MVLYLQIRGLALRPRLLGRHKFGFAEKIFIYPDTFESELLTKPIVQETPKQAGPEWAEAGVAVQHKAFGNGVIESITNDYMSVKFDRFSKTFVYPDAFTKGYLVKRTEKATGSPPEERTVSEKGQ